jgi:hypothetical protein
MDFCSNENVESGSIPGNVSPENVIENGAMPTQSNWTIPNMISVARLIAVPVMASRTGLTASWGLRPAAFFGVCF